MAGVRNFAAAILAIGAFAMGPISRAQEPAKSPEEEKVASVTITPAGIEVQVGQKVQFTAVPKDAAGNVLTVKPSLWSASPFDVADADSSGLVRFHKPGEVVVGAIFNDKPWFVHVIVKIPSAASVEIAPIRQSLVVGGTTLLTATPRSADGDPRSDVPVHWKSSAPAIAIVDDAGLVTAVAPGSATFEAAAGPVSAEITLRVVADTVQKINIEPATASAKTGDVVHFAASAQNAKDAAIRDLLTTWTVEGPRGTIYPDGAFVAEEPGTYLVKAAKGRHTAVASIHITPRNAERSIEVVSHIATKDADGKPLQSAEEWVIGNLLFYSTISDRAYVYDISDAAHPKLLDSMKADARLINDISTTPDIKVGVFTREGASNRQNGIVFFDSSDPAHLKTLSEYTETVSGGVHSAFINSHYAYITDDATGSLRVIDFKDPVHPKEVARWQTEHADVAIIDTPTGPVTSGRYLHDLYVKDGLAYLAYWRDGLVILDVGNGMKGGSPEHPQLVSQYKFNHYELYGNGWLAGTHSAFRYKDYLFVGDEVLPAEFKIDSTDRVAARGICHVMDISDIEHPREVAQYEVPEGGVHNFWVVDDILYAGAYGGAGRAVDISGELRGNLYAQGREIARFWTGDPAGYRPNLPFSWGAQPANGLIFVNDINSGIWIVKLGKPLFKGSTTAPPLQELVEPKP